MIKQGLLLTRIVAKLQEISQNLFICFLYFNLVANLIFATCNFDMVQLSPSTSFQFCLIIIEITLSPVEKSVSHLIVKYLLKQWQQEILAFFLSSLFFK